MTTYNKDRQYYSAHLDTPSEHFAELFASSAALTYPDQQGAIGTDDYPTREALEDSCWCNMHDTLCEYGFYGDGWTHELADRLFYKLISTTK